jgi:hypothetical protein
MAVARTLGGRLAVALSATLAFGTGCAGGPPGDLDDLCAIFAEKRGWRAASRRAAERWGVAESIQLAFIHQESRFRAAARPPRRRLLGILPITRPSSAYGFGQVKDGTWSDYRRATGNRLARRDQFDDVVDFIGWYGDVVHRAAGIPKQDAYRLYLAYHEGPTGYRRGSHRGKPWLLEVARKVATRAQRYAGQQATCAGSRAYRMEPLRTRRSSTRRRTPP